MAAAAQDPEADVETLGALHPLRLAEALGDAQADAVDEHRVGGVGPGAHGALDQVVENVERLARLGGGVAHAGRSQIAVVEQSAAVSMALSI